MEVDGIKISRLNSVNSVTDNDDFVVNSGGTTYKTKFSVMVGNIMNRFVNPIVDAINTAIGNEVSARQSADNILSEGLISETNARESADSALGGRVSEVNGALSDFKTRTVRSQIAYDKTSSATWYEATITPNTVSGYKVVGVAGYQCNKSDVYPFAFYFNGSTLRIGLRRINADLSDVVFTVYFEYCKN